MGTRARVRSAAGTILAIAGLVAVSACNGAGSTSSGSSTPASEVAGPSTVVPLDEGKPQSGGAMVIGMDAEPGGLSAVSDNFAMNAHLIMSSMLETLTVFDKDDRAQPYLAESLTPTNLASKWTIKLKPNIKFHDGASFNAEAAKANLEAQRKGLASIAMKPITAINVVDDLTFDVEMNQPWASFPSLLASQEGYMMSPASIAAPDAEAHPVGTGPFVFDHWDRGTSIVTKKNPNYWQAGKPYLDRLEFRILNDPAARANALESGEVNMMFTDEPQAIASYKGKPDVKAVIDSSGDAQSVVMNEASEPFDNVNARKAVVLATDSKAVTDTFGDGVLVPTDQPFSEKNAYHQTDSHYPKYDLEAAKKAVAQYTTETGKPLEFTLTTFTGAANLALAQLVQEQWGKAGIKAKIEAVDEATAIGQIIVGKTQAVLTPNFGYPDPDWNYFFWHGDFTAPVGQLSVNFPHTKIDALDKALDDGRVNLIPEKRKEAYNKATQILNDNFVYVWIYRYVAALIAADNVHGLGQAEQAGFANVASKPWYQDLWLSK
jgi:peptide/nickel transport system substrate-binding protein